MHLTVCLMVWNTAHLLVRTLETLRNQAVDGEWELLIIDDSSEDDVHLILQQHGHDLPIAYHRLEHDMGMRGNTASLNYGLKMAQGKVVMWSTPEVMLSRGTLQAVCDTVSERVFVTVPSHGLTASMQLRIDEVDWHANLHSLAQLVDGDSTQWFHMNFYELGLLDHPRRRIYGNNQTVGVLRQEWLDTIGLFPLYLDYGSDDPWIAHEREVKGYDTVTLWDYPGYHQWHPPIWYWIAQGKAPNWNGHGHTTSNLLNDPRVPPGGTCEIWDGGSKEGLSPAQVQEATEMRDLVYATGYRRRVA